MNRRKYLGALAAAGFASLSGCSDGPNVSCADNQRETPVPVYGDEGPPTVELFVDYTCPGCQEYHANQVPDLKEAADEGHLQLVHRDYPIPHSGWSEPAAYVGRAVLDEVDTSSFWEYLDNILSEDSLDEETVLNHATAVGLNEDSATSQLNSSHYCDVVQSSKSRGDDVGVEGTPQLYYNDSLHDPLAASEVIDAVR